REERALRSSAGVESRTRAGGTGQTQGARAGRADEATGGGVISGGGAGASGGPGGGGQGGRKRWALLSMASQKAGAPQPLLDPQTVACGSCASRPVIRAVGSRSGMSLALSAAQTQKAPRDRRKETTGVEVDLHCCRGQEASRAAP